VQALAELRIFGAKLSWDAGILADVLDAQSE